MIIIVGLGPGPTESLTPEASEALLNSAELHLAGANPFVTLMGPRIAVYNHRTHSLPF